MKRIALITTCVLLSAALCQAGAFKIGGHGGYTVGGDIEEEDFGYGGQLGVEFNDVFSAELSGTMLQDEVFAAADLDIYTFALSLRLGGEVGEGVTLYGGGGVSYTLFDPDVSGVDEEEDVGFLACGGLEFTLNENLELFAEYRYTFIEYDFESEDGGAAVEEAEDYAFGLIRVGLNLVL